MIYAGSIGFDTAGEQLSIYLSVCLSVCLSVYIYIYIHMCIEKCRVRLMLQMSRACCESGVPQTLNHRLAPGERRMLKPETASLKLRCKGLGKQELLGFRV